MTPNNKTIPSEKSRLHPRNKHREHYDFDLLIQKTPSLKSFVRKNPYGNLSIDFFDPAAVKSLNFALLKEYYSILYWDIPDGYLCPPIPGRADYLHHVFDLLSESNYSEPPRGAKICCLDIGVGANCIYPIIGHAEYGWSFVGTEIDPISIRSAQKIVELNPSLKGFVEIRQQQNTKEIFNGIIKKEDFFEVSICNPPFYSSEKEATSASLRKQSNLKKSNVDKSILNFGGKKNELWIDGGEEKFVGDMIDQSQVYSKNCNWFTTLVSSSQNLDSIYLRLKRVEAVRVITIPMGTGNKVSRIVAWTYNV